MIFWLVLQGVHINFLFLLTMYIYCAYPVMSNNKLSDKNRNKLGPIIFMDVLYYVHAYTVIGTYHTLYMNQIPANCMFSEWVSDCCLMPTQQFFSYIMARTS
jgi:hypothetical protein